MNRTEREYARMFGDDRLATQKDLAATLHSCCGEPRDGRHHPSCHLFVPDAQPTVIDGQESLL